ncbi:MAG: hypothetical protein E6J90_39830 [Deltaproteobacteria bacterium]|nr:MAG: hypothetical protein E6J90_39830 [Deltaproteobacteria bacterium]
MAAPFLHLVEQGRLDQAALAIEHQLRGDLGWGLQRVLDHLPHYFRCELDGQPWEPDRRTCWMPEDGT